MSRFSGKCDFYDSIEIHGIDHILSCNVYVGNSDTPLNLHSIADCVPYYPYVISVSGIDNVNKRGMIRLMDRSWVDIEEERYGPMRIHQYYRDELRKELEKYRSEDIDPDDEDTWYITPKGICAIDMVQCGLVGDVSDSRIDGFWELFVRDMERHNYIMPLEGQHEN